MDYKITCVCGHQFLLSDEQLRAGGEVHCPVCHQRLNPAIEAPPPAAPADTAPAPAPASAPVSTAAPAPIPAFETEPTRRCPFCGEVILAIARKCKHCGEFLDRAAPTSVPTAAPATAPTAAHAAFPAHAPSIHAAASANDPAFTLYTSQWDNFWKYLTLFAIVVFVIFVLAFFEALHAYLFIGVLGTLVVTGLIGWFFYLATKSTHISIRPLRIDIEKGILSKSITSLELFRVTDISLEQGLLQRILGFGTVKLTSTDADTPVLMLHQIPRAREVRQYLQTQVPLAARQRGAVYMEQ